MICERQDIKAEVWYLRFNFLTDTQSLLNINSVYKQILDIELKSFFDEVEHYVLLELIYKKIKCKHMLKLLRQFFRACTSIDGRCYKNAQKESVKRKT